MSRNQHPTKPMKPITIGNKKEKQKYITDEVYLKERYKVSLGLQGAKRGEGESYEDYKIRLKAEQGLVKEYLRGVWYNDNNE